VAAALITLHPTENVGNPTFSGDVIILGSGHLEHHNIDWYSEQQ
jgi:hypothetical protein